MLVEPADTCITDRMVNCPRMFGKIAHTKFVPKSIAATNGDMSRNRCRSSWCGPWLDTTRCCSVAAVKRMCSVTKRANCPRQRYRSRLAEIFRRPSVVDCDQLCTYMLETAVLCGTIDPERYIVIFFLAHKMIFLLLSHVPDSTIC